MKSVKSGSEPTALKIFLPTEERHSANRVTDKLLEMHRQQTGNVLTLIERLCERNGYLLNMVPGM